MNPFSKPDHSNAPTNPNATLPNAINSPLHSIKNSDHEAMLQAHIRNRLNSFNQAVADDDDDDDN